MHFLNEKMVETEEKPKIPNLEIAFLYFYCWRQWLWRLTGGAEIGASQHTPFYCQSHYYFLRIWLHLLMRNQYFKSPS